MKRTETLRRRRRLWALALVNAALLLTWGGLHRWNSRRTSPQKKVVIKRAVLPADSLPAAEVPGLKARRIWIDPVTGRRMNHPPEGADAIVLGPRELSRISKSSVGLTMTPLPGGGYDMDSQGRFQVLELLLKKPDGSVEMTHAAAARTADKLDQGKGKQHER